MTEHDEAIETAETLAELTSTDSLTKEEKQEALRALPDIMICVRECDCLTIYLGKIATDVFEAIEESMEEANEQGGDTHRGRCDDSAVTRRGRRLSPSRHRKCSPIVGGSPV